MTTPAAEPATPARGCPAEIAERFRLHRQWFTILVGSYFVALLLPTFFVDRAPGAAWALYLTMSGGCAAGSLALLTCPSCRRRVPNFGIARCPACEAPLQLPIDAPSLAEVRRWRWLARVLILAAVLAGAATLLAITRGAPVNIVFAGGLAVGGLLVASRHPLERGQICPRCRGRMAQRLWRSLGACGACGAPREVLAHADRQ